MPLSAGPTDRHWNSQGERAIGGGLLLAMHVNSQPASSTQLDRSMGAWVHTHAVLPVGTQQLPPILPCCHAAC